MPRGRFSPSALPMAMRPYKGEKALQFKQLLVALLDRNSNVSFGMGTLPILSQCYSYIAAHDFNLNIINKFIVFIVLKFS